MYRVRDGGAISSAIRGDRGAVAPRLAMARERLAVPVTVFLLSRCLLLVVTWVAPHLLPRRAHGNRVLLPISDPIWSLGAWAGSWFRYDSGWYTTIAEHGYHYGPLGTASTNFMPLYPAIVRAMQPIAHGSSVWLAAWLVANLAFLASLVVLWQWALLRTNRETALQVLVLVACFPFAFFFAAPYAEPVFFALAISAFLLAEQGRWPLAISLAALTTITRPVGMAVVLGLMALAWQRGERRWCAAAALACIPLLAFTLYLDLAFGHPLAFLTYHSYGWLWFGFMALATAIGGLAAMRIAGWKLRVVPLLLFLSMPVTAIGYYVGNDISLVFMGLMLGLLAARRYPVLAGALMAVAWLMPSVTFPLVMLIVLFHVKDRRSVLAGLVLASIALAILTLVVLGSGSFVEWVGGLSRYSRDIASQLEIAPLSGLYVGRTSPAVRTILEAASIAVALSLTLWWWVRNGGNQTSFARTGWLWFAWFLATPYAHGNDVVLLTVPILVMLGRNACHIMRFPAAPAIYLLFVTDAILPVRVGPEVLLLTTVCCIIACRKWPETVNSSRVERVESAAPSLASA